MSARRAFTNCLLFTGVVGCASGPDPGVVERSIATGDGTVFVRTAGRGPDVFLLHGLGDAAVTWRKVEEDLCAAGFRVTVWDALGAGASGQPVDADYGLPAHVERLIAVFDALGIERAHLVGNSLGGSIALLCANAHPERVDRLVLVNPAAYPSGGTTPSWFWETPWLADTVLSRLGPEAIANFALRVHFGDHAKITPEDVRVYIDLASREGAIASLSLQQRQLMPEQSVLDEWIAAYATLSAPTLILWGDADRILPLDHAERLMVDLPHAELVVVPGAGHVLQLEEPGLFLAEAVPFLATASQARALD